jgi:NAD-dependent deacetylase
MKVMSITGAGISVGSGLPTYRGATGRYTEIEALHQMPVEKIVSRQTLEENPELLWRHWHMLLMALKSAQPSEAHKALKRISDASSDYLELTQNVDGLSLRAGLPPERLVELHGSTHSYSCFRCGEKHELGITEDMDLPPRCYRCRHPGQAPIRPDVVLFGENISAENYDKALAHARSTNLLIISGTTLQFPYLVDPITAALINGALVLYVDPEADPDNLIFHLIPHELEPQFHIRCVRESADTVLPRIATYLESHNDLKGLMVAIRDSH